MRTRKLVASGVAAITMLAGGLGMALWPSSAGATGAIRKFSGPLVMSDDGGIAFEVKVHNPHPTATLKPSVVVRDEFGNVTYNQELPVGPHKVVTAFPICWSACTVEVNMTNAILQPSIHYFNFRTGHHEVAYTGDFSR